MKTEIKLPKATIKKKQIDTKAFVRLAKKVRMALIEEERILSDKDRNSDNDRRLLFNN